MQPPRPDARRRSQAIAGQRWPSLPAIARRGRPSGEGRTETTVSGLFPRFLAREHERGKAPLAPLHDTGTAGDRASPSASSPPSHPVPGIKLAADLAAHLVRRLPTVVRRRPLATPRPSAGWLTAAPPVQRRCGVRRASRRARPSYSDLMAAMTASAMPDVVVVPPMS
jgi:hypothetical protein